MKFDPDIHHRRSIRLKEYDYSNAGGYFVTILAKNRECLFGDVVDDEMVMNDFGNIVFNTYQWIGDQYLYVKLDSIIIMPNHMHCILIIVDDDRKGGSRTALTDRKPLGRIIGAFKTVSTKHINQIRKSPGVPVWHRNYYEHIIRNETELKAIREYIRNNPVNWQFDEENPVNINNKNA